MNAISPKLCAAAVVAAVLAYTASWEGFAQSPAGTAGGLAVYTEFGCGACHGAEGRGTALGPSIATGELGLSDFIDYVRQPTGTMPSYPMQALSDDALAEMHASLEQRVPGSVPAGRVGPGAALYRETGCYQCHANEGQGGAQGPRVGPDPLTLARFTWYVRNPSGGMPPYTDRVMSDQDLADIHAFLKARPQPPPVDDTPLLAP